MLQERVIEMPVYETITSRKNPLVTRMAKLGERKFRDLEGLFRLDGVKLFSEAVRSGVGIEYVFATKAKLNELSELIASSGARAFEVTDEVIEKLTDEKAPQGIVAAARKFSTLPEGELPEGGFRSLLLSSIRDPGNLGTIVRTAYAFGIDRMIMQLTGAESLRDVIAFPKGQGANCLMMDTPSDVKPEQLAALRIKVEE